MRLFHFYLICLWFLIRWMNKSRKDRILSRNYCLEDRSRPISISNDFVMIYIDNVSLTFFCKFGTNYNLISARHAFAWKAASMYLLWNFSWFVNYSTIWFLFNHNDIYFPINSLCNYNNNYVSTICKNYVSSSLRDFINFVLILKFWC